MKIEPNPKARPKAGPPRAKEKNSLIPSVKESSSPLASFKNMEKNTIATPSLNKDSL